MDDLCFFISSMEYLQEESDKGFDKHINNLKDIKKKLDDIEKSLENQIKTLNDDMLDEKYDYDYVKYRRLKRENKTI